MRRRKRIRTLRQPHAEELEAAIRVGAIKFCPECEGNDGQWIAIAKGGDTVLRQSRSTGKEYRWTIEADECLALWVPCKACNGHGTIESP